MKIFKPIQSQQVPHTQGVDYTQGRRSALPWDAGTVWPADEVPQGEAKRSGPTRPGQRSGP